MSISFQYSSFFLVWLLIPVVWLVLFRSSLRRERVRRMLLVGMIRSLLILVLGLALANPRLPARSDRVNLFFALDVSESVRPEQINVAKELIRKTLSGMKDDDRAGLILFGKEPVLEAPLGKDVLFDDFQSELNRNFTNIGDALQHATGKFPQQGQKRIVLLTDGNETLGNAEQKAHLAASLGVQIFPVLLESRFSEQRSGEQRSGEQRFGEQEVFIATLETPASIPLETPYDIRLSIVSSHDTEGELVLLRNDELFTTQPVRLKAGKNLLEFREILHEAGLYVYRAVLNCRDDLFFQNNEGLSFTKGLQKSQILYLSGNNGSPSPLMDTLELQGLRLQSTSLDELDTTLHGLLKYNAMVLDNISGASLSFSLMENIETYVKDMGGGLIMIGGEQSFGAGQYKKTPIENALPVFMDAPTDMKFSGLSLVFILDKSSSMTSRYTDKTKLELAKIATFSSIEMLNPTDSVGIVVFDSKFSWIVSMASAGKRQMIADRLTRVREGGGTDLYPALEDAFKVLNESEALRKHVIVLSDGMTGDADFQALVEPMSAAGISVSTVAIGTDSDRELLENIARWGQGRSYYNDNPDTIPRIFTGETKIVSKSLIDETPMLPVLLIPQHDMLQGLPLDTLPNIYGQVMTYPKAGAALILNTVQGPLLSAWQYGLGRSVAFTSDLGGRWGKDWVQWEHYGRFVAQLVRWAQRKESEQSYRVSIQREGEQGIFTADALDTQNRFINQLDLRLNVLFPSEQSQSISLGQIAPGRYQTSFPVEEIGAYYFSLLGEDADGAQQADVFGFGIPYTDEFSRMGVNTSLLEQLASMTEGEMLTLDGSHERLFTAERAGSTKGTALWPYLSMLSLLLLLVDVAVRKLLRTIYT